MSAITSIKKNYEFRRLYSRGESKASPFLAVYTRKNRLGVDRLGITVSTKVGKAVRRNLIRRRLREIYRLNRHTLKPGRDIVVVARTRAAEATYAQLEESFLRLLDKLGLVIHK